MPKQVWQVEDGGIFDTEADAVEWEKSHALVEEITHNLYMTTCGIVEGDVREVVEALLAHYNVTPK